MIDPIQMPLPEGAPESSTAASSNSAISRCLDAWNRAYQANLAKGKGKATAMVNADQAYQQAMPPLSSHQNIRDFIACIAHGVLIHAVSLDCSAKLLYAAQVALSALRQGPAKGSAAGA
jgi:hypothetical protein